MNPLVTDALGMAAAALTTLCWVPQAVRTIRTRYTRAISLWTQVAFSLGLALWLVYGLLIGSWPLVIANTVTLALVTVILLMKIRHG